MKTIKLIISAIIYRLSGRKICTKSMRDLAAEKTAEWEEHKRQLQEELDREHSRTWGRPVRNGVFIEKETAQEAPRTGVCMRSI